MIEFLEKEPFEYSTILWRRIMYPNVMIKDGKEYFIIHRVEPQPSYEDDEIKQIIKQLKENDGKYFAFYGIRREPIDMLKIIVENKYSFVKYDCLFRESIEDGLVDFGGNLNEVSSAFRYRIYDTNLIEDLKGIVALINDKKWDKAEIKLQEVEKKYNVFQINNEELDEMEQ